MPGNPTGDSVLNQVMAESAQRKQQLQPQVDQVKALQAQLVAVAKSGDQRAIAMYAAKVEQAKAALADAAKQALGSDAQAFLSTIQ